MRTIIHEIIKEPQVNGATQFLSEELLPINDNTTRLSTRLNSSFSKDDCSYGNFNFEGNPFYISFNQYLENPTDGTFLLFTQTCITNLAISLGEVFFAKGGFFVFCDYTTNNKRFIGIYLVRDVEGVLFNKNNATHTFSINQVRYLDTNKLAMGARINIEKLTDGDNNYVALTKSNQGDISDYFIDWIGITRPESNADFTNRLFQIISSIERPTNPETNQQYALNDFREAAFNLIKASPNKIVNLRDLSNSFYGEEQTLIDFAEANDFELDHEFRYDGRTLNKFKRITVNRDGIRLSFARGDYEGKINLSEQLDLITIRSRSLADLIRQQIDMQ